MNQRPNAGDPVAHDAHGHAGDAHDDHHDCPDCEAPVPYVRMQPKVGRNDPCTCGSGRKFKKCCGA
jgi:SEC-C motif-containing protein